MKEIDIYDFDKTIVPLTAARFFGDIRFFIILG